MAVCDVFPSCDVFLVLFNSDCHDPFDVIGCFSLFVHIDVQCMLLLSDLIQLAIPFSQYTYFKDDVIPGLYIFLSAHSAPLSIVFLCIDFLVMYFRFGSGIICLRCGVVNEVEMTLTNGLHVNMHIPLQKMICMAWFSV
eukprot:995450_1